MRPALEFEARKFLRAPTVRVITALLGVGVPVMAAALLVAADAGGDSVIALKAIAMVTGTGWTGYLGIVGMIFSVAVLLGAGFVVCWCFGREFTDHTFGALFALPLGRRSIALAKFTVLLAWSVLLCLAALGVALVAGLIIGLGLPGPAALAVAGRALATGCLSALLACPLAVVASVGRGYLAGIGALVLLIVITQLVTAFGGGAWFPYAAPGLWMGLGGPAASHVSPVQLLMAVPVAALGIAVTAWWWATAPIVRR